MKLMALVSVLLAADPVPDSPLGIAVRVLVEYVEQLELRILAEKKGLSQL